MKIRYLFLFIIFTSCHPLFCDWNSGYDQIKVQPKENEIVGIYELTKDSKNFLKSGLKKWPKKIELSSNQEYYLLMQNDKKIKNGKWFLSCDQSYGCILELEGISVEPFCKKENKFAIQITIGDADECNGLVYEKITGTATNRL